MSHTVTAKLNQAARQHQGNAGTTFFVSLGEKNYNHKTKTNEWTNYDAALFAKDAQVAFYASALVEYSVISVTGTGIILDASNPEYKPKLVIQDAKLTFVHSPQGAQTQVAPQQQTPVQQRQQAPRDANGFTQQQGGFHQPPQQQNAPDPTAGYDDRIPF